MSSNSSMVRALDLKAALRQMVDESGMPVKLWADLLGVSYSQACAYLDPSQDISIPSWRLPVALALCPKSTAVTSYFASLQQAVVVRLPEADVADHCKLDDVLLEMSKVIRKHSLSVADGVWTRDEATAFKRLAEQLQSAIAAEVLHVERQVAVVALNDRRARA